VPAPPTTPNNEQYVTSETFNKSIDELKQLISQMTYKEKR